MKRTLTRTLTIALLTSSAAAFAPAAMAQHSVITVRTAPPAPRFESQPAPRHGYHWAQGYWNWDGHRYVWQAGHWEPAREGYQYLRPEWVRVDGSWQLREGGWTPVISRADNVRVAPPPPRNEAVPHARAGFVWTPGHWEWRGRRYDWVGGTWMPVRPGYAWQQPNWVQRNGVWSMEPGRWVNAGRLASHDRDHDGVPDAIDRDRDNDGIRNRNDRDRDGDGVPNHRDAQPDNRRRH